MENDNLEGIQELVNAKLKSFVDMGFVFCVTKSIKDGRSFYKCTPDWTSKNIITGKQESHPYCEFITWCEGINSSRSIAEYLTYKIFMGLIKFP